MGLFRNPKVKIAAEEGGSEVAKGIVSGISKSDASKMASEALLAQAQETEKNISNRRIIINKMDDDCSPSNC